MDFIKNMKFNDLKKYKVPFIITITGYDGDSNFTLSPKTPFIIFCGS